MIKRFVILNRMSAIYISMYLSIRDKVIGVR